MICKSIERVMNLSLIPMFYVLLWTNPMERAVESTLLCIYGAKCACLYLSYKKRENNGSKENKLFFLYATRGKETKNIIRIKKLVQ